MTGDANIISMIQSLQNNPDLQHILDDPALMDARRPGDLKTLEDNPKFRKLHNNPTIKDISGKVK